MGPALRPRDRPTSSVAPQAYEQELARRRKGSGAKRRWRAMMRRCHGSSHSKMCSKDGTSTDRSSFSLELVHEVQTELAGSGDHDGGSEDLRDPYNDPAVGAALPSRIRKARRRYARPVG